MTRASWVTRSLLAVVFGVYLVGLVWLVLWKLHEPYVSADPSHTIKLIPFVRTATFGASAPKEVLANVAVFVPFGVFAGLLARGGFAPIALGAWLSLALESAQFITGVGVFDTTDLITNTSGTVVGVILAVLTRRAWEPPRRPAGLPG